MNSKNKRVLVVGGGAAGLSAAWKLVQYPEFEVHLLEKDYFLGGHAIRYNCKATDRCVQCGACTVEKSLKSLMDQGRAKVHLASEIKNIS